MRKFNKPDYALKSEVLKTDFPALQREINKTYFGYDVKHNVTEEEFRKAILLEQLLIEENPTFYTEARKINRATFARNTRLKKRIEQMLNSGSCLFLTLTFRDDCLNKTNADTRRKFVLRFFEQFKTLYIANVDFGKQKGREHYHAVLLADEIDYHLWEHGTIKGERVRYNKDDRSDASAERLARYTNKLVNHAIKETTKRQALIYSRSGWNS